MKKRSSNHSRGFATTMALMLIALVGCAMFALTSLAVADLRRGSNEARDAQLRQMVLAAAMEVRSRLRAGESIDAVELKLPGILVDSQGKLEVQVAPAEGHLNVNIIAHLGDGSMQQTIRVARGGEYRITLAKID